MKRIALITGTRENNDCNTLLLQYAKGLQLMGLDIFVFCPANSSTYKDALSIDLQVVPIKKHHRFFDVLAANRLNRLFKKHKIEKALAFTERDEGALAMVKRFMQRTIEVYYLALSPIFTTKKMGAWALYNHRKMDGVLCPTMKTKNYFEQYGIYQTKVLPIACEEIPKKLNWGDQDAKCVLGVPEDDKLVYGVELSEKNRDAWLHMLPNMRSLKVNYRFLLLDRMEANNKLIFNQTVKALNLEDVIVLLPAQTDLFLFYKAIDAYILFGNEFELLSLDAIQHGTAVFLSENHALSGLIEEGTLGYLFNEKSRIEELDEYNKSNYEKKQTYEYGDSIAFHDSVLQLFTFLLTKK